MRIALHFRKQIILLPLFLMMVAGSLFAGITGKVTLKGKPKNPDGVIQMTGDRNCHHDGEMKTERWKIGADGALEDVVVSVKNVPGNVQPLEKQPTPLVNQEGCRYLPHVTPVKAGEKVIVKNSDKTLHNVRGVEFMGKGKRGKDLFNIGQPIQGLTSEVKFDHPGVYQLRCDVHPWMLSWVVALGNAFYDVTDCEGKFQLPEGLPDGEYVLQAWHQEFVRPLEKIVHVADGSATQDFEFDTAVTN